MIVQAKNSEIPEILALTRACAKAMIANGIYQWNEHYPTAAAFEHDLKRDELYVYKIENRIVGTLVISTRMDDEYVDIDWLSPNGLNIYIHRLAVHPEYQGQGIARTLMDFAEAYAREHNFISARLDTFSQNKRNHTFYENRGYKRLANIYFPKQSEHPFYCYELLLN